MTIPTFVSAGIGNAGLGDVTVVAPAGSVADDIWLLHVESAGEDANPENGPAGWTRIASVANDIGGSGWDTRNTLFWLRYDGTDPDRSIPDAGDHTAGFITAWRGCITTESPINAFQTSFDDSSDKSVSCTGVTTDTADCLIVITTTAGDNTTFSAWANSSLADPAITEAQQYNTATGTDGAIGVAYGGLAAAGVSGTTTASTDANEREANIVIALKPEAVAPPILKIINETENSDETQPVILTLNRLLNETFNPRETAGFGVIRSLILNRVSDETENSNETIVRSMVLARVIDSALNISEATVNILASLLVEVISEAVNAGESVSVSLAINRLIDEAENIQDGIIDARGLVREFGEALNVQEADPVASRLRVRILNEVENILETKVNSLSLLRLTSESVNLSEDAVNVLAALIIEIISETQNITEANLNVLAALIVEIISESVNHPETIAQASILTRQIAEVVNSTENLDQALERVRIIFESVNIQENNNFARSLIRIVDEGLSIVENIIKKVTDETIPVVVGALSAIARLIPGVGGSGTIKPGMTGKPEIKDNE